MAGTIANGARLGWMRMNKAASTENPQWCGHSGQRNDRGRKREKERERERGSEGMNGERW